MKTRDHTRFVSEWKCAASDTLTAVTYLRIFQIQTSKSEFKRHRRLRGIHSIQRPIQNTRRSFASFLFDSAYSACCREPFLTGFAQMLRAAMIFTPTDLNPIGHNRGQVHADKSVWLSISSRRPNYCHETVSNSRAISAS